MALISASSGLAPGGFRVAIMIPYPSQTVGTIWAGPDSFNLQNGDGRRDAAIAYMRETGRRFSAARYGHLVLYAYYWLNEEIRTEDSALVRQVSDAVHQRSLKFFWVPYYDAAGSAQWRAFGFDRAWLQPNYFFHPEVSVLRLDTAVSRARADSMGLEIEFNDKLFGQWQFADRLTPYLSAVEAAPDIRARSVVIYEGVGALIQLARSRDPWHRAMYQRLVEVLKP